MTCYAGELDWCIAITLSRDLLSACIRHAVHAIYLCVYKHVLTLLRQIATLEIMSTFYLHSRDYIQTLYNRIIYF